ncbi:NADP-dependent oxidoreductase [Aeromicrobium ponti]|uniref:NADPH:quinone reductase-like Zn-dependent oxidoreductase n=1 Tax=Cytobacillus oceanisediminis TaxID=665099 RepID=A0A562K391_9BACI|nr:NADP-dependent oxidoreductase [Cytobacillus oceanisediminis]TWH89892.1 NADPH:quinone reductase-like Zn-dependent oxidoreductase [Cytobacillus oceanisediminis]
MKAIIIEQYGTAEELKERKVPMPEMKDNQVLVEMHATSINPIDWKLRAGYLKNMLPFEFPIILGWDAAGVITEVGDKVTSFKKGDRVFARPDTTAHGTYAEYVAVDEKLLAKMPENASFEEAASIPLAGLTAWQCLVDFSEIKSGDKVLIHAGAGGVGSLAIQIAKSFGAHVASTASGKNKEFLKSLGVDHFINYREEDFEQVLDHYDIVVDTMGGEIQKKSMNVLKKGGKLVSIVSPPDENLAKDKDIKAGFLWLEPNGKQLSQLGEMIEKGKLKPLVGHTFPFTEQGLKEAHELSESHHAKGKIAIKIK